MERQAVEEIEATLPEPTEQPERLVISADGAFIGLTIGEWREVKTVAIGEFAGHWNARKSEIEVKSSKLSYFSRSYSARDFEHYALAELDRREIEKAKEIVTVNDGAAWIQSFIDFAHALGYVGRIGKTILGEETLAFSTSGSRPNPTNLNMNQPIAYCQNWLGLARRRRLWSRKRSSSLA